MSRIDQALKAAKKLSRAVDQLHFGAPVTHVYNPLKYAWSAHAAYLRQMNPDGVRVLLLGMNPGPWGMAQTGVPFGEVDHVRDWLRIEAQVKRPTNEHPRRPIEGFACQRSEVSGRRLWGLFRERFKKPATFFKAHFVANYCPLVFMEESGRNRTPDKLPADEREPLDLACDTHLATLLEITQPDWAVGVGKYAEKRLQQVVDAQGTNGDLHVTSILHPSPASPAANRGWAAAATRQLVEQGVWRKRRSE